MAWVYLILAGMFEVSWPTGFKLAQLHPDSKFLWISFSAIGMAISGFLLYLAQKTIPVGTAYAAWAGIGAIGTFLLGVIYFHDATTIMSWVGIAFIVLGIVLLKTAHII